MKKLAFAIAILAISAVSASAADMAPAPYTKAPVVIPPVYNWTGFYVGGNVGGTGDESNTINTVGTAGPCNSAAPGCTAVPNYSTTSAQAATFTAPLGTNGRFIGGGQIGYNWQFTSIVTGFEADIQGTTSSSRSATLVSATPNPNFPGFPVNQTATVSKELNYLGTARGRIGDLFTPGFLGYVTGGLAYGGVNTSTNIAQDLVSPGVGPYGAASSVSTTRAGWTVGAGAEWMFAHNWSAKVEYLYYDLGCVTNTLPALVSPLAGAVFSSASATSTTRYNGNIVRFGVNYHFDGPVVARY
jgi:outer membrane immunogenic protein